MKPKLTEEGFAEAARLLGCDVAAIKAVCEVEAPKGGFLPDDRVTILFERHKFHRFTGGIYSKQYPDISNPSAGGYGSAGAHQYERFSRAFVLDPKAAMKSCSWGKFQIMGFNFASAGFDSLDSFVTAMKISEDEQLKAFVHIVKSFALADELRRRDWAAFARGYNGANYRINRYDTKLAAAYRRHSAGFAKTDTSQDDRTIGSSVIDDLPAMPEETQEPISEQGKSEMPGEDKGVTTSSKPASETEGTPPPTPAAEVKASQPSWQSRITNFSLPAGVVTAITTIWTFAKDVPPWGWALLGGIFIVSLIVWAWLHNESQKRAQERTSIVLNAAADRDKNNLRLV